MEIHPQRQKTLPDFLLTEKLLGIRTVDIVDIKKRGPAFTTRVMESEFLSAGFTTGQ